MSDIDDLVLCLKSAVRYYLEMAIRYDKWSRKGHSVLADKNWRRRSLECKRRSLVYRDWVEELT